jgi:hypothetical protein
MSNFNFHYHRKTLTASNTDHPYIKTAVSMLDNVETAMSDLLLGNIDIKEYINCITPYDQFMWEKWHELPQKSNPINIGQNKKYSSWREQKWAPIFELVRDSLSKNELWSTTKTIVIQNQPIVETIYSNGYTPFKDVDGGLAIETSINSKKVLIPVLAVEDKGGHACSTCFNGVNAQGLRLHQSFPNAKHIFITDNNVSVGVTKGSEIADHINLVVCERGTNRTKEKYPALRHERFQQVKDTLIEKLSAMTPEQFTTYIEIESSSSTTLRKSIDKQGILWNW